MKWNLNGIAAISVVTVLPVLACGQEFELTDIGRLVQEEDTWLTSLNNKGTMVGYSRNQTTFRHTAIVVTDGLISDLTVLVPQLKHLDCGVSAVNDLEDVVGEFVSALDGNTHAYGLFDRVFVKLEHNEGAYGSWAHAMNNRREVVGTMAWPGALNFGIPVVWHITRTGIWHEELKDRLADDFAEAWDINERSLVVGNDDFRLCNDKWFRATQWQDTQESMMDDPDECAFTSAFKVNDYGDAVGWFGYEPPISYDGAALWKGGIRYLTLNDADGYYVLEDINNGREICGYRHIFEADKSFGIIDRRGNGEYANVNSLIGPSGAGYYVFTCSFLNDVGQVLARATLEHEPDRWRAVLLNPVHLTVTAKPMGHRSILVASAGATPNERVLFVGGLRAGSFVVPACGGIDLGIEMPQVVGRTTANTTTNAWVELSVPERLRGRELAIRALEHGTCRMSPVLVFKLEN